MHLAEKDLLEKTLEEHNDVFADIVNALGFGGEELVSPESLKPGPTASIYEDPDGRKREQHRDVVKYCTQSGVVLALFGLENQSGEDYDMVFRMMSYDGAAYKQQKGRCGNWRYSNHGCSLSSFIGFYVFFARPDSQTSRMILSFHWFLRLPFPSAIRVPAPVRPFAGFRLPAGQRWTAGF